MASLLLIHDLYPVPLEERVLEALDTVRPYMESHGGDVELLGIEDGVARLALQGSCNGCAASRATLELAIKQALEEHAPDLAGLEVEGVAEPASAGRGALRAAAARAADRPVAAAAPAPRRGALGRARRRRRPAPGRAARARRRRRRRSCSPTSSGSLLAYRDACAACGAPLRGGELHGDDAALPELRGEFDLPRAGRAAGGEPLQLTPVPLLAGGGVRVAV